MDFLQHYWWLIVVLVALVLAFVLLRPRQRVQLTESTPVRPHMAYAKPSEGRGIARDAAAAASDVTSEILSAPVRGTAEAVATPHDDLCRLKGVGPKFADALHALGFTRFEQIAHLSPTEIDRIDSQLGAFSGRLTRDRIVEQADYLARDDTDGFEQTFGKL